MIALREINPYAPKIAYSTLCPKIPKVHQTKQIDRQPNSLSLPTQKFGYLIDK